MKILFCVMISASYLFISLGSAQADPAGKWELYTKDGPSDCPGYVNGGKCQLICIRAAGKNKDGTFNLEKACTKANYIDSYERFKALKRRMHQVEDAMNNSDFKGWSMDQLSGGFYQFASKIAPETVQSDTSQPSSAVK